MTIKIIFNIFELLYIYIISDFAGFTFFFYVRILDVHFSVIWMICLQKKWPVGFVVITKRAMKTKKKTWKKNYYYLANHIQALPYHFSGVIVYDFFFLFEF